MRNNSSIGHLVLFAFGVAIVVPASVAIKHVLDAPPRDIASGPRGDPAAIVALRDGSTLMAQPGTPGRQIVDWLAADAPEGRFELGGRQFTGRSAEPTVEAKARVPRLIAMLRSDSSVHVDIVGHSDHSGDAAADRALSEERARSVERLLHAGGITRNRIHVEGRGGAEPIADEATADGRQRNQRVSLILWRRGP
jgi:hypothetical protein